MNALTSNERLWGFDVGYTDQRPIIVDQYNSRVHVLAPSYSEAIILAVGICDRGDCEMVTSTTYVE